MAIAVSLMARINGERWDKIEQMLTEEWSVLHANGIVPQKPRRS